MRFMTFEQWSAAAETCENCGDKFWGDSDKCPGCRDSEVGPTEDPAPRRVQARDLPTFGVPTTKSQNIYYL